MMHIHMDIMGLLAVLWIVPLGRVLAAETNLSLSASVNSVDAGLTALGLITALVTTIMRGRLDAENNTRDLLTYLKGRNVLKDPQEHSMDKALLVVEEKSLEFARQMFAYYAGNITTKGIDIIEVHWLTPNPPQQNQDLKGCKPGSQHKCKCLAFKRVIGVSKHLVIAAPGDIIALNSESDAIMCTDCRDSKCHDFARTVFQDDNDLTRLGLPVGESNKVLMKCIDDLFGLEEKGRGAETGVILLDPVAEVAVKWSDIILEASMTKDDQERGSPNKLKNTLDGIPTNGVEYSESSVYRTRLGALVLASTLTVLFRTDAFSSIILARRALRGYILDSTGTKLPLESFCSQASCKASAITPVEDKKAIIVLKPKKSWLVSRPKHLLLVAAGLEVLVVFLWITAVAITPWRHIVGNSYLDEQPTWASILCSVFCVMASLINFVYYFLKKPAATSRRRWAGLATSCACIDSGIVALTCILAAKVVQGELNRHWLDTLFRALMMVSVLLQWRLGVELIDPMRAGLLTTINIVPYALTYMRLLSMVVGAGKWA